MEWGCNILNFLIDLVSSIRDIYDDWKDKDEKVSCRIIGTIITLFFLGLSAYIWLL